MPAFYTRSRTIGRQTASLVHCTRTARHCQQRQSFERFPLFPADSDHKPNCIHRRSDCIRWSVFCFHFISSVFAATLRKVTLYNIIILFTIDLLLLLLLLLLPQILLSVLV